MARADHPRAPKFDGTALVSTDRGEGNKAVILNLCEQYASPPKSHDSPASDLVQFRMLRELKSDPALGLGARLGTARVEYFRPRVRCQIRILIKTSRAVARGPRRVPPTAHAAERQQSAAVREEPAAGQRVGHTEYRVAGMSPALQSPHHNYRIEGLEDLS